MAELMIAYIQHVCKRFWNCIFDSKRNSTWLAKVHSTIHKFEFIYRTFIWAVRSYVIVNKRMHECTKKKLMREQATTSTFDLIKSYGSICSIWQKNWKQKFLIRQSTINIMRIVFHYRNRIINKQKNIWRRHFIMISCDGGFALKFGSSVLISFCFAGKKQNIYLFEFSKNMAHNMCIATKQMLLGSIYFDDKKIIRWFIRKCWNCRLSIEHFLTISNPDTVDTHAKSKFKFLRLKTNLNVFWIALTEHLQLYR